jgi:hypothetical protein
MPFILLPPLGGIRGGACDITLFFEDPIPKRGEITHAPLEFFNICFIRNHKKKF